MKKFLFVLITVIGLYCSQAFADEGYWPRSYFLEAGFGIVASKGDLNEHAIKATDTLDNKVEIHPPAYSILGTPDLSIGANVGAFTLALNYQYWKSTQILAGFPTEDTEESSRIWRLGFEFTYNVFFPEFFQIGLGLGYSFTNIKTEKSAFFDGKAYSSELMGSAVAFIANIHYYISDNFAMVPAVKVYENWFKNVYTSKTETCDLDPYLWQTFVLVSVSLQFQF